MNQKEQVNWCLNKALAALKDYDAENATKYIEMAKQWNNRG